MAWVRAGWATIERSNDDSIMVVLDCDHCKTVPQAEAVGVTWHFRSWPRGIVIMTPHRAGCGLLETDTVECAR